MTTSDFSCERQVDVLIQNKAQASDRCFTYAAPDEAGVGQRVLVPLGESKASNPGIIVGFSTKEISGIRPIHALVDKEPIVDEGILEIAQWIREDTLCNKMEALELFYPKGEKINPQGEDYVVLQVDEDTLNHYILDLPKNSVQQLKILKLLKSGICRRKALEEILGKNLRPPLRLLEERGILQLQKKQPVDFSLDFPKDSAPVILTEEQNHAMDVIEETRRSKVKKPVLLHGITGSGKTQVYIKAMENTLLEKRQGMVLVPEISLTPQTIERFYKAFGSQIAVLHSKMSEGERQLHWQRMKTGACNVVIGARSALFAPFWNLGMIIIDECHESAYNSEKNPRYQTVKTAEKLAQVRDAVLILGSATPRVEQYYKAEQDIYQLVELKQRPNGISLPQVHLIDMSLEHRKGSREIISEEMQQGLEEALERKEQGIVFLNRRGFANFLSCPSCGYVHKCPHCDITLHYHKAEQAFKCHYCNYKTPFFTKCPSCEKGVMEELGVGIQKVEEELGRLFPGYKVLRMDKDTARKKGSQEQLLLDFRHQKAQILLGTQMIGKGLDFPNVTFVGVLNGDIGLNAPDFRSAEKTFSLMEQVTGRCGRGSQKGVSFIQTYESHHWIYPYIQHHDYKGFYKTELEIRKKFSYSPFASMVRLIFSAKDGERSGDSAQRFAQALQIYVKKAQMPVQLMGPAPCLVTHIENQYRWQIVLRTNEEAALEWLKKLLRHLINEKKKVLLSKEVKVLLEMDPDRML